MFEALNEAVALVLVAAALASGCRGGANGASVEPLSPEEAALPTCAADLVVENVGDERLARPERTGQAVAVSGRITSAVPICMGVECPRGTCCACHSEPVLVPPSVKAETRPGTASAVSLVQPTDGGPRLTCEERPPSCNFVCNPPAGTRVVVRGTILGVTAGDVELRVSGVCRR